MIGYAPITLLKIDWAWRNVMPLLYKEEGVMAYNKETGMYEGYIYCITNKKN